MASLTPKARLDTFVWTTLLPNNTNIHVYILIFMILNTWTIENLREQLLTIATCTIRSTKRDVSFL